MQVILGDWGNPQYILISSLLAYWYVCSQHPFGLPLTVNGMLRTQSDDMHTFVF